MYLAAKLNAFCSLPLNNLNEWLYPNPGTRVKAFFNDLGTRKSRHVCCTFLNKPTGLRSGNFIATYSSAFIINEWLAISDSPVSFYKIWKKILNNHIKKFYIYSTHVSS